MCEFTKDFPPNVYERIIKYIALELRLNSPKTHLIFQPIVLVASIIKQHYVNSV